MENVDEVAEPFVNHTDNHANADPVNAPEEVALVDNMAELVKAADEVALADGKDLVDAFDTDDSKLAVAVDEPKAEDLATDEAKDIVPVDDVAAVVDADIDAFTDAKVDGAVEDLAVDAVADAKEDVDAKIEFLYHNIRDSLNAMDRKGQVVADKVNDLYKVLGELQKVVRKLHE